MDKHRLRAFVRFICKIAFIFPLHWKARDHQGITHGGLTGAPSEQEMTMSAFTFYNSKALSCFSARRSNRAEVYRCIFKIRNIIHMGKSIQKHHRATLSMEDISSPFSVNIEVRGEEKPSLWDHFITNTYRKLEINTHRRLYPSLEHICWRVVKCGLI